MATSVAFTKAITSVPTISPRSSTERVVMTEVTMPAGVERFLNGNGIAGRVFHIQLLSGSKP